MRIQGEQKYVLLAGMTGFLLGICSANLWMKQYVLDIGILNQYFLEQYNRADIVYEAYLCTSFQYPAEQCVQFPGKYLQVSEGIHPLVCGPNFQEWRTGPANSQHFSRGHAPFLNDQAL